MKELIISFNNYPPMSSLYAFKNPLKSPIFNAPRAYVLLERFSNTFLSSANFDYSHSKNP